MRDEPKWGFWEAWRRLRWLVLAFSFLLCAVVVFGSTADWVTGEDASADGASADGSPDTPYLSQVRAVRPLPETVAPGRPLVGMQIAAVNDGSKPAFVRLMVTPYITMRDGVTPLLAQLDAQLLARLDEAYWRSGGDGWYYYLDILPPGRQTPPLFTEVKLAGNLDDSYREADCQVSVECEAVHTRAGAYRLSWWGSDRVPAAPLAAEIDAILRDRP